MKCLSFALALVACGGATGTPLLDSGDGDDATTDSGQTNDGQSGDAQPGKDGGSQCTQLFADLEEKRTAAVQCCLTCGTLQCTQQIEGLCCPLTVTSGDSLSAKAYENALQAVKDAKCPVNCPPVTCSAKPSNVCQTTGSCAQ
jgi:hypothetical protein